MKKDGYVLFLTPSFYPNIGGVEKHVLRVSQELNKKGYRVVIVTEAIGDSTMPVWRSRYISADTPRTDVWIVDTGNNELVHDEISFINSESKKTKIESQASKSITVYRLPYIKSGRLKKLYIWFWFFKNKNIIQSAKYIHCHDVFYWYIPFRFLYPRKRVYTTFHGYEAFPVPRKNIIIRKISEKFSNGNICVGDFIKKWYGTRTDFITYGGVDSENLHDDVIRNYHKPLNILLLGRLDNDIGISLYLSALDLLKARNIKFDLTICGNGKLSKRTKRYGNFMGFVNDTSKYIKEADIVFSSSYLSILESLIFKKMVVAAYENPLKKDYLEMTPFSKWINIVNTDLQVLKIVEHLLKGTINQHKLNEGYKWAVEQKWERTAELYIHLWSKF